MEMKNRGDLTINGFGASNGGEFHRVVLNGKGTVNTDLDCVDFECHGNGLVNGNLNAKTARISGNGKVIGNIESEVLSIEGRGKIEKNAVVKKVKVSGSATISGSLKSEEVKVRGRLTVGEDCEAEVFKAECQFSIGGLLNADEVDVRIYGECKAEEIGGQTIMIKQKTSLMGNLFKSFFQNSLDVHLIEGDHIEIENTNAKIVRGNHITIGPNCNIGLVEYTGSLTQHKKAVVNEAVKGGDY
jgi:cytoskeletal protein CcmA (bactofilin family)